MHGVASSEQAKKMEAAGVDAIIAEGGESGGFVAKYRVSTLVLVPMTVDAVRVPVVAAGGIGDSRGLIAALAMGAQGVQLGTAFEVSEESSASRENKKIILKARETDTLVVSRGRAQARVLKDEIHPGGVGAGQISGMVTRMEKAADIIERMMSETRRVLKNIETQVGG